MSGSGGGAGGDADRAAALALLAAAGVGVPRETIARLDAYVGLLRAWNPRINLVGPATLERAWTRHVADALQLPRLAPGARTWADLGSGAGLPGVVIAVALAGVEGASVTLVESNNKKAAFLREAIRLTGAPARVVAERVEAAAPRLAAGIQAVSARALAPLPALLALAEPFLAAGAVGVFPKGREVEGELTRAGECWTFRASRHPSLTDAEGCVLVIEGAARKALPDQVPGPGVTGPRGGRGA